MIPTTARTEIKLWERIRPFLIGEWYRTEFLTPPGLFDSFGLVDIRSPHTVYLEHKIGRPRNARPSIKHLRPSQLDFMRSLEKKGMQGWTVFADKGVVRWFRHLDFEHEIETPYFIRHVPLTRAT